MFHVEYLRRMVKAAIKRGDMQDAWFWVGIIVCLPPEHKK